MEEQKMDTKNIMDMIRGIAPKHCDFCGGKYTDENFSLVRTANQQATLHLKCEACGNSYMLNVFSPSAGLIGSSRSQLNLDVDSPKELTRFASETAISVNQALDAYNLFLREPKLISDLFKKKIEKNQGSPKTTTTGINN